MDGAAVEARSPTRASNRYRRYTPTWPELPRPQRITRRVAACRMRSETVETRSPCASSRAAAAGISAISRAIAVAAARSPFVLEDFIDGHAQIAVVPP